MVFSAREIPGNGVDDDGNGFIDDYYGYDFRYNDPDPMDENELAYVNEGTFTPRPLKVVPTFASVAAWGADPGEMNLNRVMVVEVMGRPMLDWILEALASAGFRTIVVSRAGRLVARGH